MLFADDKDAEVFLFIAAIQGASAAGKKPDEAVVHARTICRIVKDEGIIRNRR